MILTKTAVIKLNIDKNDVLPSIIEYTKAFNHVCNIGFKNEIFNGVLLHRLTYQDTRKYLPSQLAISARMKATLSLKNQLKNKKKQNRTCPKSKLQSVGLDVHSYSLFLKSSEVSILTISGRKRYKLEISDYHKEYFSDWKYTSADLCVRKNKVYLHICFQKEIADIKESGNLLGIDRGINNLAVTSDNKFYGGGKVKQVSERYRKLRARLQSKGTKSAKRHLRKLYGKERRFKADENHKISKKIIASLKPGVRKVLEDLTG